METKPKIKNGPALQPGWWVAVTLKPGTAPLRSYVGQIQAIDSQGMRITLIDWLVGMASGWDVYIPHSNLESALVATDAHEVKDFGEAGGKWQNTMNAVPPKNPSGEK